MESLAYYHNEGCMKTDMLAKVIKEVVRFCHDAGLVVKSMTRDQEFTNVAAINRLYEETREYFIGKGEDNRLFDVLIGGEEIVPKYDTPHLMKRIRNNFHKCMVRFKGQVQIAKWEHIVNYMK